MKVRDLAKALNGIQSFMDGYMTAQDLVGDDIFDGMVKRLDELKQQGELGKMGHRHHIAPRALAKRIAEIGGKLKNFDVNKFLAVLDSKLHLSMHGKGYNKLVGSVLEDNKNRIKKNPLFLIGFLAGLLEELGFDEAALVP
jgi:hypothetical protein